DDQGICTLVQKSLERLGVEVVCATDAVAGLALLTNGGEFDAVALDNYMPTMDGMAALTEIHKMPNHPPVIFVTGAQDFSLAVKALKAGAFDYVVKDIQGEFIALLMNAMQTAVNAMRLQRDKETAEAELRDQRDRFEALAAERAMLLGEVNHRVGNSLQLIASLLMLQRNATSQEEIKSALGDAINRVHAVGELHRRLHSAENVQEIDLTSYVTQVVDDLRKSSESSEIATLSVTADDVVSRPDLAVSVGMIVNELVVNAMKYAYPGGSGPIRVSLKKAEDNQIAVTVEDDGVGSDDDAGGTAHSGLGTRIVKAMAQKINGVIARDPDHKGTRITVTFTP
ncbi:MAG: sensor histidine kinase, partial [Xanthobacteraceae bacterium]